MAVPHSDTSQRLKPRKFKLGAAAGSRALSKRLYGTAETVPFPDSRPSKALRFPCQTIQPIFSPTDLACVNK